MPFKSEIRQFIVENFMFGQPSANFADDASFLENGIIDSTGVLELVAFVERQYGISVADEDLVPANLDSVDNLVGYITRRQGAAQ